MHVKLRHGGGIPRFTPATADDDQALEHLGEISIPVHGMGEWGQWTDGDHRDVPLVLPHLFHKEFIYRTGVVQPARRERQIP